MRLLGETDIEIDDAKQRHPAGRNLMSQEPEVTEIEEPKFWRGMFALTQMVGGLALAVAVVMVVIWAIFRLGSLLLANV